MGGGNDQGMGSKREGRGDEDGGRGIMMWRGSDGM